jgi:hypothetical protein
VTAITGNEPKHWHDANGKHRMPDPRKLNVQPQYWAADERAYVAHLEMHENAPVEREDDDAPEIAALFDLMESREREITTMRQLILTLRMRNLTEANNEEER